MIRGRRTGTSRRFAHRQARQGLVACAALAALSCSHDRGNGPVTAETIALTSSSTSVAIGNTVIVYVHASDANGTRIPAFSAVTWSSSNPTVASVAKLDTTAVVTALAAGETVITATVRSGLAAQLSIRVGAVPVIIATPSAAVFTGYRTTPVAPQSIVISNGGAGALAGLSVSTSVPWLQASFVGGITSANPSTTLQLQAAVGTLNDGTYSGIATVSSSTPGVTAVSIPVTFQVAAGPVAFKIEALTPPSQAGSAGKPVAQPPKVVVRAADNTPVSGVTVTFAVSGGGTIVPSGAVTTDANGVAAVTTWTLGSQAGASQTVTASAPGLAGSPVTFTATALAASRIAKVSGDEQTTVLGRALPQPLVVRVTDPNDAPVPNATVAFSAAANGVVTPAGATTDANGLATATWTLGPTVGAQAVTAVLVGPPGAPFVTFTATASGATAIVKVSGDGQQAFAGSDLPTPLRVRVTGAGSLPVTGVTVTFAPAAGGGTATPPTATTDANGEATTKWTLPTSTGAKSLVASVSIGTGTGSVTFAATALAPPPSGIVIIDGDNQTGRAATALPRQVVARVVNTLGTGVPGVAVTFTPATGAGQSLSPASGVSDANGDVRTTWTLGSALGTYTATVSASGLPTRTITATANQLPPNAGTFTGGATKVPSGGAPTAADQAVFVYSGPASGEVALRADGTFATPSIPSGTYVVSIASKSGAFPTTVVFGVSLPGGQSTSVGTIPIAYSGTGAISASVHSCPLVGAQNGTATVKLFAGINGDGGSPAYTWSLQSGVPGNQSGIAYGIYTMTISVPGCAAYRTTIQHSWTQSGNTTALPLITLSDP
jgi:adhesin/invasin